MDLVISFDSEDFLTSEAADAEKWWAQALRNRGLRGCFQLVAEMVRTLKRNGRGDVIDAFRPHEIGFHSNYHSIPPSIPERIDGKTFAESLEIVLRAEASGFAELVETFGRVPVSYCSPGDSWSPATLVAMGMLGVKCFCNTPLVQKIVVPYWYCGSLVFNYDIAFESYYDSDDAAFKMAFDKKLHEIERAGGRHIVVYTHPTRLVTTRFWDAIFFKATDVPPGKRTPAPLRSSDEIERIKGKVNGWLDWLVSRQDLRPTTYAQLHARHSENRKDLQAIMDQAGLRQGDEGKLVDHKNDAVPHIPGSEFGKFTYGWPLYREGFTGKSIIEQAVRLAWTSAPAW